MLSDRSNLLFALTALLLVGSLVLSGCAPLATAAPAAAGESPVRTVTVIGRGEVKAQPDTASTSVGVEVTAPTVDEAMAQAKERMAALLAALKALGIAEKDIQTSNFSVYFERTSTDMPAPRSEGAGSDQQMPGFYRVSNMVQVTIRDLEQVGEVLETAVKAGANNIWGINFSVSDPAALEAQARENAVKDARARAEALAGLHDVELGGVIAVSEVVGGATPVFVEAAKALGGGGAPVEPGELTLSTQIQVVYAIK